MTTSLVQIRGEEFLFSKTLPRTEYKAERALRAMYETNESAQRNGISDMSLEEINAEISECRKDN